MHILLALAQLPTRMHGRILMAAIWGAALLTAGITDGRSLAVLAPFGLIALLHGWGVLTNWGGIWDKVAEEERRLYEATEQLPLGRTRVGRLVRDYNRQDNQVNRGFGGAAALIVGPVFIVLGVLAGLGILDITAS